jgi:hypothetical protein
MVGSSNQWLGGRSLRQVREGMPIQRRRLRRVGTAGLGLFALLLQLALSFGHIHPETLRPALASLSGSPAQHTAGKDVATVPDDQKQSPGGNPEDDCLICLTMHMAAAGAQPSPPLLFVPVQFSEVLPPNIVEKFLFRVPRHTLFQTRAPPIV